MVNHCPAAIGHTAAAPATDRLGLALTALAASPRRAMVDRLLLGRASVSELAAQSSSSLPTVLKHVRALEAGGVTRSYKDGRTRWCELREDGFNEVTAWLDDRRARWERTLDRFQEHITASQDRVR